MQHLRSHYINDSDNQFLTFSHKKIKTDKKSILYGCLILFLFAWHSLQIPIINVLR